MFRSVAWLRWPMGLKSFSPAQPWGRTGSGNAICTEAIARVGSQKWLLEERAMGANGNWNGNGTGNFSTRSASEFADHPLAGRDGGTESDPCPCLTRLRLTSA